MSITTEMVFALALAAFAAQAGAAGIDEAEYGFGTRPSEAELGNFV